MIKLHNRTQEEFWLNEELILRIKGTNEARVELIDGVVLGVTETAEQIVGKIAASRAYVLKLAATGEFSKHPDLNPQEG